MSNKISKSISEVIVLSIWLIGCRNSEKLERQYYSNGELKTETHTSIINGDTLKHEKLFYHVGFVKADRHYKNQILHGQYLSFNEFGSLLESACFVDGIPVGPIRYYYNNNLVLYNERDFKGDVYYVKKYDSATHKLIREEGAAISSNVVIKNIPVKGKNTEVLFFYAEPDGDRNIISVEINGKKGSFDTIMSHVGRIKIDPILDKRSVVKIKSELKIKFNDAVIIDSVIVNL
jgi:antitoxin component YwqK of YwqJK toxin-antitoxin module